MDPKRLDRLERANSWPSLLALLGVTLVGKVLVHRFATGTWHEEPSEWLLWFATAAVVYGLMKVLVDRWIRRQRTRNRPST